MLTDGDRDYPICGYSYGAAGGQAARLLEKAIQKLAEYEEMECRGKLIRKPCFIGGQHLFEGERFKHTGHCDRFYLLSPLRVLCSCKHIRKRKANHPVF